MNHQKFLDQIYPLHRTLISQEMSQAMDILGEFLKDKPSSHRFQVLSYSSGTPCWTWKIPQEFVVKQASLSLESGQKIVDFKDHPLHLVSYSVPIQKTMSFAELEPHLHSHPSREQAIPWVFRYYSKEWGFCLPRTQLQSLPRDQKYRVDIQTEFPDGNLLVGEYTIPGESEDEILIIADLCHPYQVNDSISGACMVLELIDRFQAQNLRPLHTLRFLFLPETIGTIAYLSRREKDLSKIRYAVFADSLGREGELKVQTTRQGNSLLDLAAKNAAIEQGIEASFHPFRSVVGNDELISNGPDCNIPTLSLVRHPFAEYHSSDDTPDLIHIPAIIEAADFVECILFQLQNNFLPQQSYKGVLCLSAYDLFVEKTTDRRLNKGLEKLLLRLQGEQSLIEIVHEVGIGFLETFEFLSKMKARGLLVEREPTEIRYP